MATKKRVTKKRPAGPSRNQAILAAVLYLGVWPLVGVLLALKMLKGGAFACALSAVAVPMSLIFSHQLWTSAMASRRLARRGKHLAEDVTGKAKKLMQGESIVGMKTKQVKNDPLEGLDLLPRMNVLGMLVAGFFLGWVLPDRDYFLPALIFALTGLVIGLVQMFLAKKGWLYMES